MRRYELTDEQFELIADLMPPNGQRGGQWNDHCTTLNGIFWILHSGAQWREMPDRYGKWKSVHKRFTRWAKAGVWEGVFASLTADPDNEYLMLDSTLVRAHQQAATGKEGTKIRLWGVPEVD